MVCCRYEDGLAHCVSRAAIVSICYFDQKTVDVLCLESTSELAVRRGRHSWLKSIRVRQLTSSVGNLGGGHKFKEGKWQNTVSPAPSRNPAREYLEMST